MTKYQWKHRAYDMFSWIRNIRIPLFPPKLLPLICCNLMTKRQFRTRRNMSRACKKKSRYFIFNVWNWHIQEEWRVLSTSSKTLIIDKKSWKKRQTHLKCLELTSSGRTTSTSSKTAGFVGLNLLTISLTAPCHSVISKTRSAEWIMDKVM